MNRNEAIETLKAFLENSDNVIVKDAILELHPALAESKDEKIRTFLIDFIKVCGWTEKKDQGWPLREDCIAYLEKQKPANPFSGVGFDYNGHCYGMCARDNGVEVIKDGAIIYRSVPPFIGQQNSMTEEYIANVFEKVGLAKIVREQGNDALTNAVQSAMIELSRQEKKEDEESERIRKALVSIVKWLGADSVFFTDNFVSKSEVLAYVEKQKEPAPIPDKFSGLKSLMLQYFQSAANRKDDVEIENDTDLWGRKILDYVWKCDEEQKKQKHVNWTELNGKDIAKLEVLINNVHNEYPNGIGQESFGEEVLERFREYKGDEDLDEKEQKSAEWSEEDEETLACVISVFEDFAESKNVSVPPASAKRYLKRLKSLLSQPKPSGNWKPTKKQLIELRCAISGCSFETSILEELENQLKAL